MPEKTVKPHERRLPFAPLEPYLTHAVSGVKVSDKDGAERAPGMGNISYYRSLGSLNESAADQIACRVLGIHPMLIWGDDWFDFPGLHIAEPQQEAS
jgi:hypothetical protein